MFESFIGKRFFVHVFFYLSIGERRHKYSNNCVFCRLFFSPDGNENPGASKPSFSWCKKRLKEAVLHHRKISFAVRNCNGQPD